MKAKGYPVQMKLLVSEDVRFFRFGEKSKFQVDESHCWCRLLGNAKNMDCAAEWLALYGIAGE